MSLLLKGLSSTTVIMLVFGYFRLRVHYSVRVLDIICYASLFCLFVPHSIVLITPFYDINPAMDSCIENIKISPAGLS